MSTDAPVTTTTAPADRPPVPPPASGDRRPPVGYRQRQRALLVAVAVGGACGAVARYAVSLALPTAHGAFPWGTLTINLSGSALLGVLLALLAEQFTRARLARPLLGTGFVGAYTTFSTFAVEAVDLGRAGHWALAALYVVASSMGGLAALWAGMAVGRSLVRLEEWLRQEAA
jgi:CrcB protein